MTNTAPTFAATVEDWLAAHPGDHSPYAIASALGEPTQRVAATLARLTDAGRVQRHRHASNGPGASTYST